MTIIDYYSRYKNNANLKLVKDIPIVLEWHC